MMTLALTSPRHPVRAIATKVYIAVTFGVIIWFLVRERANVVDALGQVPWWSVPAALVPAALANLAIFRSWAAIVSDSGVDLDLGRGIRVYGLGALGKYLPGSIWSVAAPAQLAREYGFSAVHTASSTLVALYVSVTVALGLGYGLSPWSLGAAGPELGLWPAPLAIFGVLVLLAPRAVNTIVGLGGRLLRRSLTAQRFTGHGVGVAAVWAVVANICFGVHLVALGHAFGLDGGDGLVTATSAYSIAAAVGVLIFLAPAGAGARDGALVVILSPAIGLSAAVVVALLSRVVTTLVELGLAITQVRRRDRGAWRRPIFVTRRFPPSVGGMETLAAGVWRSVSDVRPDSVLIAHGGSNKALLWWLPRAWLRLLGHVVLGRAEVVLVGDAPTFAIMEPILRVARVRTAVMVLGLDVTYENPLYARLVHPALRRADSVIAISAATRDVVAALGIRPERITVLRLGVVAPDVLPADRQRARAEILDSLGLPIESRVLLTLGRLVQRKGVRWFVGNVLPDLPMNVHYVVAGDGPELEAVREAAVTAGVADRTHLLGRVSDEDRERLMQGTDVFVQPNVRVPGDMEGFGLVAVEAAMRGALVVAADLEGLKDAVLADRTGVLLPPEDAATWSGHLTRILTDPAATRDLGTQFQQEARDLYGERAMGKSLCEMIGIGPASV